MKNIRKELSYMLTQPQLEYLFQFLEKPFYGSRLGFEHPKGMYVCDFNTPKSIFQMTAERIQRLQELASQHSQIENVKIHWFLMTNEETTEEINEFFKVRYQQLFAAMSVCKKIDEGKKSGVV